MTNPDELIQSLKQQVQDARAAVLRHRWWIFGLAVVIAALMLYMAFRPGPAQPAPPIPTASKPEYIYLDTAAARATRRADSLQQVADYYRAGWKAALSVSNNYKKQVHEVENLITDIRNGAVAGNLSAKEIADFLLRFISNNDAGSRQ